MKIGVSSYSYSRLINEGKMSELQVISKAREMGFDVIEFAGLHVPAGETIENYVCEMKEECNKAGIEIGNYTIGADFLNNGDWETEAKRLEDEVKTALLLGAPGIRHDATRGPGKGERYRSFDEVLPTLIKGCRHVTKFAQELGIRTMVENHGFFCQDSERVEKLVNGVDHENFGILVDMGNFLCADEEPAHAVGRLMPYAFHLHAKDFHVKPGTGVNPGYGWFTSRGGNFLRGAIIGHGDVPVQQCLGIAKKSGYNGTVSIEFEGIEDPLTGIKAGLENLRRFIEAI